MPACTPAGSASCQFEWQNFHDSYGQPGLVGVILVFLPGIVGAFAGAPVLARELETGTFRYAWTQGVGRMRWADRRPRSRRPRRGRDHRRLRRAGELAQSAAARQRNQCHGCTPPCSRSPGSPAPGGRWPASRLGVLAGLLWRRVLPALVTAFAAWFGLAFLAAQVLRRTTWRP